MLAGEEAPPLNHQQPSPQDLIPLFDQSDLFDAILNNTDYDPRERPHPKGTDQPVEVRTSMYVYFLGHVDEESLEFETHLMIRHRWEDPRLQFRLSGLPSSVRVGAFSAFLLIIG